MMVKNQNVRYRPEWPVDPLTGWVDKLASTGGGEWVSAEIEACLVSVAARSGDAVRAFRSGGVYLSYFYYMEFVNKKKKQSGDMIDNTKK